jgi:branched-chain amino acid transport system permease protein
VHRAGVSRVDLPTSVHCAAVAALTIVRRLAPGAAVVLVLLAAVAGTAGAQEGTPTTVPTSQAPAAPTTELPGPPTSAPDPDGTPGEPDPAGPRIVTTLRLDEDRPVRGGVVVVELDGEEVGRERSGADGSLAVPVPGPGTYVVRLVTSSLPEGVELAEGAPQELRPIVQPSGDRPVVFRLVRSGEAAVNGPSDATRLAGLLASGLRLGLVIALAAVGLSLIYGTTGLTNFAHGELVTFGAIAAWYLNSDSGAGLPLWLAAVGALVLSAGFGASFELGIWRPLRRRGMPILSQMVVSIGLAFAGRYLFSIIFGSGSRQYRQFAAQAPTLQLGPLDLRPKDVVVTVVAAVALVLFGLFLERSRLGTAIRAVSDNRDLSVASGIDDQRVILLVWIVAGAMAGLGGVMLGTTVDVSWNMGQQVLLIMFAAVVLGGLGTAFGAMVGGLIVGIVSDVSTFWLDADLKIVVALATLVVVLLVRPQGVFGVRARTA